MRASILATILVMSPLACAQTAGQTFPPDIEEAARDLGKSLRCVVCQNQSIEDSGAPLAADMRRMVRERLAAGESRQQIMDYMTDRYGNFVLLTPPFQTDTLLLWLGPLLFAAIAAWGWLAYLRPASAVSHDPQPLSKSEIASLQERMKQEEAPR